MVIYFLLVLFGKYLMSQKYLLSKLLMSTCQLYVRKTPKINGISTWHLCVWAMVGAMVGVSSSNYEPVLEGMIVKLRILPRHQRHQQIRFRYFSVDCSTDDIRIWGLNRYKFTLISIIVLIMLSEKSVTLTRFTKVNG